MDGMMMLSTRICGSWRGGRRGARMVDGTMTLSRMMTMMLMMMKIIRIMGNPGGQEGDGDAGRSGAALVWMQQR